MSEKWKYRLYIFENTMFLGAIVVGCYVLAYDLVMLFIRLIK